MSANTGECQVKSPVTCILRGATIEADPGIHCFDRTRAFFGCCVVELVWTRAGHGFAHEAAHADRLSPWCWPARLYMTRLETRTKESIHMCEYVGENPYAE